MIALDIDMPKGCELCPCNGEGYCGALYLLNKEVYSLPDDVAYSTKKRYRLCPLIDLSKKSKEELWGEKIDA